MTQAYAAHLQRAVADASLVTDPGPHMIVPHLLPTDLYTVLLETMPPPEGFDVSDETKANFDPDTTTIAPEYSRLAWQRFHHEVVDALLTPLLVDRFQPHLARTYRALFGPDLVEEALKLDQHAFRGRLMLRRRGYRLKPHRDTKIAAITGLIYFARPGDSPAYGTDLYRVENDQMAPSMKTFYPEQSGGRAELVRSVPFVGNTALIFLNTPGLAHAAAIPRKAAQAERYAYQFYIGPPEAELGRVVRRMPTDQQALWGNLTSAVDRDY